jgi:hypothetical protein
MGCDRVNGGWWDWMPLNESRNFNIPNVVTGVSNRPPSVVDPNSPDFDIDEGNTGTNLNPEYKPPDIAEEDGNWMNRLMGFLANLIGITADELQLVLILIGAGIAVITFGPLIIGFVKGMR